MNSNKIARRPMGLFAALLALLIASPMIAAGSNWYQIELLLFLNPAPSDGLGARSGVLPSTDDAIPLQLPRQAGAPYSLLPSTARQLNAHRLQLNRTGRYQSLLHLAWRQPVATTGRADTLSLRLPPPGTGGLQGPAKLNGTLRITRGRFLHVDLDVNYLPPQSAPMKTTASGDGVTDTKTFSPRVYRLTTKRRMRRDELHYLDSPGLGALIIAQRYNPGGGPTTEPQSPAEAEVQGDKTAIAPN